MGTTASASTDARGITTAGTLSASNRTYAPMEDADGIAIEALLDDVMDERMIAEAIDEAFGLIQGDGSGADTSIRIDKELRRIERERERLMVATTAGHTVTGLLEALQALEDRKRKLGRSAR